MVHYHCFSDRLKFEDGYNSLVEITELILNISTSLKRDLVPGQGARVIMILHSSAPIDLEHNVASQQTNAAIINTLSGQPSACFTQRLSPPLLSQTVPNAHFIIITTKSPTSSNKHQLPLLHSFALLKAQCFVKLCKLRQTVLNNAWQKIMLRIHHNLVIGYRGGTLSAIVNSELENGFSPYP